MIKLSDYGKKELQAYRADMLTRAQKTANIWWREASKHWPINLAGKPCPTIQFNNRYTRAAGYAYGETNTIELGFKFFLHPEHRLTMFKVIIPHEVAHIVDFVIHGEMHHSQFHGENWQRIMRKLGQLPNEYHFMDIVE